MARSSARKRPQAARKQRRAGTTPDPSFEQWLDGRLKALYTSVLKEPLPDDMLKLLEERPRRR